MAFASNLRGHTVIDDSNWTHYRDMIQTGDNPTGKFSGGLIERNYGEKPLTKRLKATSKAIELIPEVEWDERIEEMERTGTQASQLHDYYKLRTFNQNGLGWCWCYGTVKAMQMAYARQGTYVPDLCAASLAAKIKGYQDEGGWAGEAIEGNLKYGCSTTDFWEEHANDRRYDTPEQRENAQLHLIDEYEELPANDFRWVMSAALSGMSFTLGLAWWGHLVCGMDPIRQKNGRYGIRIKNSWGEDWEKNGYGILDQDKAVPMEICVIRSMKPARA